MEVGIDFGTTFSTLSFSPGKGVEGCIIEGGSIYIPTVVGIRGDNTYTVGLGALQEENLLIYRDIKRFFGVNIYNFKDFTARLEPSFEVVPDEWNCKIGPISGEKGKAINVVTLAALFVKALVESAVKTCGAQVRLSVCSVPAEYNSYMRSFIYEACKAADIHVQAVVNEPTAAGLSVFISRPKSHMKYMLVYDFGGGTFDSSLLVVGPSYVCVVDSSGDNYLGGRDVDNKLRSHVARVLGVVESTFSQFAMEALKIDIVDFPNKKQRKVLTVRGEVKTLELSFQTFSDICLPFVRKTIRIVEDLLARNNVSECVAVLIGGSSILPNVLSLVSTIKGVAGVSFDRKTYRAAVAMGASFYAQTFTGATRYRLIDSVSNSLSDERIPLKAVTVFPKGHPIPAKVEVEHMMPNFDTGCVLHEGESPFINWNPRTYSADVKLKKFSAGVRYKQTFSISEDGRLEVFMGDERLINVVQPKAPRRDELNLKFLSTDEKRIRPEVENMKLFYEKVLKARDLRNLTKERRREIYISNGLESN